MASNVMASAVAVGATEGSLLAVTIGSAAMVQPLVAGPTKPISLFWVTSFVAALPDSEGSDLLSASTIRSFLPFTPPALLISSTAILQPDSADWP